MNKIIHVKGAREHNLKNIDIKIPHGQFVTITGLSGSGKSSLAFDTIYAEGYRKYMDSLSARAKQLLEQINRPDVDYIEGLSPVIAIEQRTGQSNNPRSTVGTITEIADYARILWALKGIPYCPKDNAIIQKRSLDDCISRIYQETLGSRLIILAPYMEIQAALLNEEIQHIKQKGYQRIRINDEIHDIQNIENKQLKGKKLKIDIVIDRIILQEEQKSRLADSLELAFKEGQSIVSILSQANNNAPWKEFQLSQEYACTQCQTTYPPVTPRNFSFNHPLGACPTCEGIGKTYQFNADLLVPDSSKSLKEGAIKALRLGSKKMMIKNNALIKQLAEQVPFDINTPWVDLSDKFKNLILYGDTDLLFSFKFTRAKAKDMTFSGVLKLLSKTYKETSSDGLRARLMAYQVSGPCPECQGSRLNQQSNHVLLENTSFGGFMKMDIETAFNFVSLLENKKETYEQVADAIRGLKHRLHFLNRVGLQYLTLNRQYNTLSGGEAQRVRLATQLGMGLTGVLYILDEPSIGLHAYDHKNLTQCLMELKGQGNSLIVVEHDEETIRNSDHLIELGPGAGPSGGHVIFEGSPFTAIKNKKSLTGAYLAKTQIIQKNTSCKSPSGTWLTINEASENNLKSIDVSIPTGLFTCVCGVSGSGKSTLINDILAQAALRKLNKAKAIPGKHKSIKGLDFFYKAIIVDQSPIGKTPRSNPATYTKLFDALRNIFSQCPLSKARGYKSSRFSFNVKGGRCERCQGDGAIALDMQFMGEVFAECPSCHGKRYNRETLEVRFKGLNIAEALNLSVDEAIKTFSAIPSIYEKLRTLQSVGLGYIKLGQPANTLSGGEAQRIKLSLELSKRQTGSTLYILDEPTTGLHWDDIQKLLDLLFKLRDAGHTIIVIEHHLNVIHLADWLIELGPEGGHKGGQIVFEGPPNKISSATYSKTAICLKTNQQECPQVLH